MEDRRRSARIILFLISLALLNFPFIGLPEKLVGTGRFPLLPIYLIILWLLIVIGVYFLSRRDH
ncbi:MAG: hypothetical protein AAF828_05515 [Bacteroidota bacterium]